MKKVFFLCITLISIFEAVASEPSEFNIFKQKLNSLMKSFGIGFATGSVSGIIHARMSSQQPIDGRNLQNFSNTSVKRDVLLTCAEMGTLWATENIIRNQLNKKMNTNPKERNLSGWVSWSGSWCGFLLAHYAYEKYKNLQ